MAYPIEAGIQLALNNTPTTATYASDGALGATSVVIGASNSNIVVGQTVTGTGFAANTLVTSIDGTTINFSPATTAQVAGTITFSTTWYKLTDHNRSEISIQPELIEKSQRMANGTMRKYVVAKKHNISTSWDFLPAKTILAVDGNYAAAWLEAFYNANCGIPIFVKVVKAKDTAVSLGQLPLDSTFATAQNSSTIYEVFMTGFSNTVRYRTTTSDYVNMSIEFTEV
jgi:hypothetical protein